MSAVFITLLYSKPCFRIANLSNPQHKYKVETNAQQYMLTGLMLLFKDNNLVVIEGGPKALRKYKRLMLNRISWDSDVRNRKGKLFSKASSSQRSMVYN